MKVVKDGVAEAGLFGEGDVTTVVLSGYRGQVHVTPAAADLYECAPDFQVDTLKTASTTQSGRIFLARAPRGARWQGGYIHGLMDLETEYSMYSKTGNGGAPFHFENVEDFVVERLLIDGSCWDPIRPGEGVRNPTIRQCLVIDARDECVEADHTGFGTLTVSQCFFKNAHTYISSKPGKGGVPTPYKWVVEGCLLELSNNQRDSRSNRKYPWSPTNYGSGQPWKTYSRGTHGTMLIKDCTLMWRGLPKQATAVHTLIPENMVLDQASGNNVFVWLGPQTAEGNGGVGIVAVPKIGGGAVGVPESILGTGNNRARILATYSFTDDESYWTEKVQEWEADVWSGPLPEPEPTPDPEPEPEPEPEPMDPTVIPHEPEHELAVGGILVGFTTGSDVNTKQGVMSKDHTGFGNGGHTTLYVQGGRLAWRHQTQDTSFVLTALVAPNTAYQALLAFDDMGTTLYVNKALMDGQSRVWSLVGNTEPTLVGANADISDPGSTTPNRDPFKGVVSMVEFLTPEGLDVYFSGDEEEEDEEEDEVPTGCEALEAEVATLKSEIMLLNEELEAQDAQITALEDRADALALALVAIKEEVERVL